MRGENTSTSQIPRSVLEHTGITYPNALFIYVEILLEILPLGLEMLCRKNGGFFHETNGLQGCDCAANWLILAIFDPNFVISEISVN